MLPLSLKMSTIVKSGMEGLEGSLLWRKAFDSFMLSSPISLDAF